MAIACTLFLVPCHMLAQLEYANWQWADSNMVTWVSGSPIDSVGPLLDPFAYTDVDMSTISDKQGNLLISTNGREVFNGAGQTMMNGNRLGGSGNSPDDVMNTLLCPKPCDDSLYYLILVEEYSDTIMPTYGVTLRYFEINPYANGGQGMVLDSIGTLLENQMALHSAEICRHANNKDFWLVNRLNDNSTFQAWQITDTGISVNPVVSVTNNLTQDTIFEDHMAISPDGNWIAVAGILRFTNIYYQTLFTFDNTSGQVGFFCPLTLPAGPTQNAPYPCFSPGSSKLYITPSTYRLLQYDLSSGDSATIANSAYTVAQYIPSFYAGLSDKQIAIDGKIYITRWFNQNQFTNYGTHLAVINNPDDTGSACGYVYNGFQCNQETFFGLPNVIHNWYVKREISTGNDSIGCTGDTLHFVFSDSIHLDSAHWFIGDNTTPQQFFVSDTAASVAIDSGGLYPILAVAYSGCRLDTFVDSVLVLPTPDPNLGPDTILCEGDTIAIANDWQYSYTWSTGDSTQGIQVLQPDTFWLELSNYCGTGSDTVVVDSIIAAFVEFPTTDTLLCEGDTLNLDATVDAGTYMWSNGFTGSVLHATTADTYWVESQNACATSSDTIDVRFTDVPELPELDAVLCLGDTQFYDLITDSLSTFLWYDGDITGFDTISQSGTVFWVEETNLCGFDRDTFSVATVTIPTPELGADTLICESETLTFDVTSPHAEYLWSASASGDTSGVLQTHSAFYTNDTNLFKVTITNACGDTADSIQVITDRPLRPELTDTTMCVLDHFQVEVGPFDRAAYAWSDGDTTYSTVVWGVDLDSLNPAFSVTVTNACGAFSDTMQVLLDQSLRPDLGDDRVLCFGDTLVLTGGVFPRTTYQWSDSATVASRPLTAGASLLPIYNETTFILSVTNTCNTFSDTVVLTVDSMPSRMFQDSMVYICRGSSQVVMIDLNPLNADSLLWEDGRKTTDRTLNESRFWRVDYFNRCGATNDTVKGQLWDRPSISLEEPPLLCEPSVILAPTIETDADAWEYAWSDGTTLSDLFVDVVGSYAVTVTDDRGCADSLRVRVRTCGNDFYAPNAFSPDGNPFNQYWKPVGEGIESYTINIYDRWGELIYSFTDQDNGWDGSTGNGDAPLGVYSWRMELKSEDFAEPTFFEGVVTLLR